MKRKAIIVDIDGCLLDNSKLYLEMEKKFKTTDLGKVDSAPYNFFHANCNNADYVSKVPEIFNLVNYYNQNGYAIIILTSRRDLIRKSTLHYLLNGDIKLDNLTEMVLRPANKEGTPSYLYKKEEIQKLHKRYDIELILDDEYANCAIFRQLGFTVLRVIKKGIADE